MLFLSNCSKAPSLSKSVKQLSVSRWSAKWCSGLHAMENKKLLGMDSVAVIVLISKSYIMHPSSGAVMFTVNLVGIEV